MAKLKQKIRLILGTTVLFLVLLPILYVLVLYYQDERKYIRIENYYRIDAEIFEEIAGYFKNLYSENLYAVEFDCNNTYLELFLEYVDEDGKYRYVKEKLECADAIFVENLSKLREKYQKKSEYPVFTDICVSYSEDGKMMLYMAAYNEANNSEEARWYYLIYMDEEYDGKDVHLGIDMRYTKEKPFEGNWYTWSKDWPFG